jgi:hypothetical protein
MERRRVRIHCENPRSIRLNSHDRVVSIVLERILRQWLLEMPRQSVLELNCFSEQGGKVVILAASTPLHVFVSSRTHELVAQINHILLPYELMFQFQEREHGSVLILRPPQLDLAGSRVFTSHRAS